MHTKSALRSSATRASSYDSPSMTWHQWHHTAPMSSRMGLSSVRARANAASPHGCQCTGWWAADLRYAEGSETRRLDIEGNLPTGRFQIPHHRPRHQLGPDDQAVLVDVERGTVMRRALPLGRRGTDERSEEHTSELQSRGHLVCRLLLEKKKHIITAISKRHNIFAAPLMLPYTTH